MAKLDFNRFELIDLLDLQEEFDFIFINYLQFCYDNWDSIKKYLKLVLKLDKVQILLGKIVWEYLHKFMCHR